MVAPGACLKWYWAGDAVRGRCLGEETCDGCACVYGLAAGGNRLDLSGDEEERRSAECGWPRGQRKMNKTE